MGEEDNMPQIEQLRPIPQPSELSEAMERLDPQAPKPLLTQLDGGILGFREAIFPDIDYDKVYAQKFLREPKGRGAHFDVYNTFVDQKYPFVGVYNLTGNAVLRAVVLSKKLQEYYDAKYPDATDEAFAQRRTLSSLALSESGIIVMEGEIKPASGIVFPQFAGGRHLVHDIVPIKPKNRSPLVSNADSAGSFVKFAVPKDKLTAKNDFISRGYLPFSKFIEEQLAGVSYNENDDRSDIHIPIRQHQMHDPGPSISFFPASMPKRRCNLD